MKLLNQRVLFFYIACIGAIFISSCAPIPPYGEEMHIIVSPHKLSVHSGSEDTVFVKLLDKQGGPLFGMEVKATSSSPTVATITPTVLTDVTGKAAFTVKGISTGTTHMVFSVAGIKATMEVIFVEH